MASERTWTGLQPHWCPWKAVVNGSQATAVSSVAELLSDPGETLARMDTLFDLAQPEDREHALIAHYRLSGDEFGEPDERASVYQAERAMTAAVREARVGEVDGNEFGGGEAVLYAYGPDAEALFTVMEPMLRVLPFRPAYVIVRRGDRATESRIEL